MKILSVYYSCKMAEFDDVIFGFPETRNLGPRTPRIDKNISPLANSVRHHAFQALQQQVRDLREERVELHTKILDLQEQLRKTTIHKGVLHKYLSDLLCDSVDASLIISGLHKMIELANAQKLCMVKSLGKDFLNKNQELKELLLPCNIQRQVLDIIPLLKEDQEYKDKLGKIMTNAGEDIIKNVLIVEPILPVQLPVSPLSNILGS